MSLMEKLRLALAEISEAQEDPWKRLLERALPANVVSTSTVALLELLGVPPTTGNARRLGADDAHDGLGRPQIAAARTRWVAHHSVPRLVTSCS